MGNLTQKHKKIDLIEVEKIPEKLPKVLYGITPVFYKNRIYIFGGQTLNYYSQNEMYSCNPADMKWEKVKFNAKFELQPSCSNTVSLLGNKIYFIGGWTGFDNIECDPILSFNLDDYTWEEISADGEIPQPLSVHTQNVINREIYIFGGGEWKFCTNDLHKYDVDKNF